MPDTVQDALCFFPLFDFLNACNYVKYKSNTHFFSHKSSNTELYKEKIIDDFCQHLPLIPSL